MQIPYEGSDLWKHIEYTNEIDRLSNMARYIEGAILYHKDRGDEDNEKFFTEAQEHWKTKIKVTVRKSKKP